MSVGQSTTYLKLISEYGLGCLDTHYTLLQRAQNEESTSGASAVNPESDTTHMQTQLDPDVSEQEVRQGGRGNLCQ